MNAILRRWTLLLVAIVMLLAMSSVGMAKQTVTWWTVRGLEGQRAMDLLIAMFEKENPDIEVKYTIMASWDDLHRKLLTAIAGGAAPDLVMAKDFWIPELAARNVLLPLDDLVKRDWNEINPDDTMRWIMEGPSCTYQGVQYGMPAFFFLPELQYNVDLFNDAGLDRAPDTWDEVREFAKKLTRPEKDQWGTWMYTYSRLEPVMVLWCLEMFAEQNGTSIYSVDEKGVPTYHLKGNEKAIEALQFWVDNIYKYGVTMPPDQALVPRVVEDGRVAMWYTGQWTYTAYPRTAPNLRWSNSLVPKKENRTSIVEAVDYYILRDSKNQEAAWKFVKFMLRPENDYIWGILQGYLPIRTENFNSFVYQSVPQMITSIAQYQHPDTKWHPYHNGWVEIQSMLAEEIQKALYNTQSVEKSMEVAQQKIDQRIAELFR